MSKKLKLGVVGAGNIFKLIHADAWIQHAEVEIAAVCDPDLERAKSLAKELNVMDVYTDYHEILQREDIDMVDISTPNISHSEIAIAALEAGKHVFCEKPDAINPEGAIKMANAAKKNGKTLMVMRNNRFRPDSRFMKNYIEEGHMGEIYTGRCGWLRRRGIPGKGGWFTTKAMSGGGPLIDLGVHMIDLSIWLMGSPQPVTVSGSTYCKFANSDISVSKHSRFGNVLEKGTFDVEDLATGFIRFDNGASLQIEFSWASNIKEEKNFYELRGTNGGCTCSNTNGLEIFTEISGVLCDLHPKFSTENDDQHLKNIYHFVDVVQKRTQPINTPQDGIDMVKILGALYESAQLGREIRLL